MRRLLVLLACALLAVVGPGLAASAHPVSTSVPVGTISQVHVLASRSTAVKLQWKNPHSASFAGTGIVVILGTHPVRHVGARGRTIMISRLRHIVTIRRLLPGRRYTFSLFASSGAKHYARPATVRAVTAPAGVSHLHSYAVRSGATVHWQNPGSSSLDHVVVRYARGYTAPVRSNLGRRAHLAGPTAEMARLSHLTDNAVYSVAIWTVNAHGRRSTPKKTTFTSGALRGPRGAYAGTVLDNRNHPLLNADVAAIDFTGNGSVTRRTATGVDGRFRLRLAPGTWFIDVGGQHLSGGDSDPTGYVGFGDQVVIHSGRTRHAGAIALAPGGAISGRVTDLAGDGLSGAQLVSAPVAGLVQGTYGSATTYFLGTLADPDPVFTASDGRYAVKGLPVSGALRVCAATALRPVTGGGAGADRLGYTGRCLASGVLLTAGAARTEPDLALDSAAGGEVSGTVTSPSGSGVGGWTVSFEPPDDYSQSSGGVTTTNPDGSYDVAGLAPGKYQVCSKSDSEADSGRTGYVSGCRRALVTVSAGQRTTRDLQLAIGGAITGTVRGPGGIPVPGIDVQVEDLRSDVDASTDASGHYIVKGLHPGKQTACFLALGNPVPGHPTGVLSVCHRGGRPFDVGAGSVRNGFDASLPIAAAISGTVRDSAGKPVAYAEVDVEALDLEGDDDGGQGETDAAGHYLVPGLEGSKYRVCFSKTDLDLSSTSRCYRGHVPTTYGRTTTGIDGVLPVQTGITAVVRDRAGHPVAGVVAVAIARTCPRNRTCEPVTRPRRHLDIVAGNTTDRTGTAALGRLAPGHYVICLFAYYGATARGTAPDGYADRCSNSTYSAVVRPGRITTVHETLSDGGAVSGTITDGAGHPIAGVVVGVSDSSATDGAGDYFTDNRIDGGPLADNVTRSDGTYTIRSVQPGRSTVCANTATARGPNSGGYFSRCFGAKVAGRKGGTAITVVADKNRTGTDLALTAASEIGGTVTGPGGTAESSERVLLYVGRRRQLFDEQFTDDAGAYAFTQLTPGRYSVCYESEKFQSQCYRDVAWRDTDNAPPLGRTTLVTASAGAATDGIDFHVHY